MASLLGLMDRERVVAAFHAGLGQVGRADSAVVAWAVERHHGAVVGGLAGGLLYALHLLVRLL